MLGESHYREFKSAVEGPPGQKKARPARDIAYDVARALVAFANTEGGELFVGVEDDNEISGIGHLSSEDLNVLLQAPLTHVLDSAPLEQCIKKMVEVQGKLVCYFSVEKNSVRIHQTSNGQVLQRVDGESKPADYKKIEFERQEQRSREFDRSFERNAKVTDLNMDLLRYVADSRGITIEKWLQHVGLAEYYSGRLNLRRAALLLFAEDIRRWFPQCAVRVLRIRGTEPLPTGEAYDVSRDESVSNNIFKLINEAWNLLRPHLATDRFHEDMTFRPSVLYPEEACREALVNALAHRDYTITGRSTEIFVYDDRIEVCSPGGLLCNVTIDGLLKLKGLHESRNPYITRVLREIGHMRELGEGIRRMFDSMRDHELRPPELNVDANNFNVVLFNQSAFAKADQLWLDGYRGCPLSTDERLVLLLGKEREVLSFNDIHNELPHERFELTDMMITRMRTKGLLTRDTTKTKQRIREIKNLRIVSPSTVKASIVDLEGKLKEMAPVPELSNQFANRLKKALSESSVYKQKNIILYRSLEYLGYIDEDGVPTDKLIALWPEYQELPQEGLVEILQHPKPLPTDMLRNAIDRAKEQEGNNWVKLTTVGAFLQAYNPNFATMDYGFGGLAELIEACSDVFEIRQKDDEIRVREKNGSDQQDSSPPNKIDYVSSLIETYNKISKGGGWVFFGALIREAKKIDSNFTPHSVGYRRFSDWLDSISDIFEIRREGIPGQAQSIFVRKRSTLKQQQNLKRPDVAKKAVPQGLLVDAFRNTRKNEG